MVVPDILRIATVGAPPPRGLLAEPGFRRYMPSIFSQCDLWVWPEMTREMSDSCSISEGSRVMSWTMRAINRIATK